MTPRKLVDALVDFKLCPSLLDGRKLCREVESSISEAN